MKTKIHEKILSLVLFIITMLLAKNQQPNEFIFKIP